MHRARIELARRRRMRLATHVELKQVEHEEQSAPQQDHSADQRHDDPGPPTGDDRIRIVEGGDPAPLAEQPKVVPGQRHDQHAGEPQP